MSIFRFPKDFTWGVATSAQQIEGAWDRDGRGESVWDRFAIEPGTIEDGSRPTSSCRHYDRWQQDVELIQWLEVSAYRFSVGWSRIMPTGHGKPNPAGLDFYDRLVDALLAAGIDPFLTLNHWDMPQGLQDRGGWPARDTCAAFGDYAVAVARRLGDRVRHWTTHNEPWCVATLGYEEGVHAPGHHDPRAALRAAHHLLLSHGQATDIIRHMVPGAEVGIVLNISPGRPATTSKADDDAVRQFDGFFHRWYLDPLFRGRYPDDAIADRVRWGDLANGALPFVQAGDMDQIRAPIDYLGINYYSRTLIEAGPDGRPRALAAGPREALTEMGWAVDPEGLLVALDRIYRDYGSLPLYITENGAAFVDPPPAPERSTEHSTERSTEHSTERSTEHSTECSTERSTERSPKCIAGDSALSDQTGKPPGHSAGMPSQVDAAGNRISDPRRVAYVRDHLVAAHRALERGIKLRGYFVWSLMDNFEWNNGFTKRFGLFGVDFTTGERTPKDSAFWYRDIVAARAVEVRDVDDQAINAEDAAARDAYAQDAQARDARARDANARALGDRSAGEAKP